MKHCLKCWMFWCILAAAAAAPMDGRGGADEVRELLEALLATRYCGDAMLDGLGADTAIRGQSPISGNRAFNVPEEEWVPVLLEMTEEELKSLSRRLEGTLVEMHRLEAAGERRDNSDDEGTRRLWELQERIWRERARLEAMAVYLGHVTSETNRVLETLMRVVQESPRECELYATVNLSLVDKACRDGQPGRCVELGRWYRDQFGNGSYEEWELCKEFAYHGLPLLPTDAARREGFRYVTEFGGTLADGQIGGWFDHAAQDTLPGWAGSLQRRQLAERCLASAEWAETPGNSEEQVQSVCPWAAAELAAEEGELVDLRKVFGDWGEEKGATQGFRVVDLSKAPVIHGRGPEMREWLDRILDTEYCGDAMMEGVTQAAAIRGEAPVEGPVFGGLDEEDWPVVLLEMAEEEFERLSREGKLHSIMDVKRLRDMIGLLGTARGDATPILAFFRKMAEQATWEWDPVLEKWTWDTVLFTAISYAWIDLTIEKEGADKSLELGRVLETSCGADSMPCGIFLRQLGRCDAFGRCKTPEDLAMLSRFMLEKAEHCHRSDRAGLIDQIAVGDAYYHHEEGNPDPFAWGSPHMGVPGWKGSLQRKRLAERFKDEPAKPGSYQIDPNTGEWIAAPIRQRDIDRMIWSRAASQLATEDSELTDLRQVYGDWTKEEAEE